MSSGMIDQYNMVSHSCEVTDNYDFQSCCHNEGGHEVPMSCDTDCEMTCICCIGLVLPENKFLSHTPVIQFTYVEHSTQVVYPEYSEHLFDFLRPPLA